jgi:hypothetical protein
VFPGGAALCDHTVRNWSVVMLVLSGITLDFLSFVESGQPPKHSVLTKSTSALSGSFFAATFCMEK